MKLLMTAAQINGLPVVTVHGGEDVAGFNEVAKLEGHFFNGAVDLAHIDGADFSMREHGDGLAPFRRESEVFCEVVERTGWKNRELDFGSRHRGGSRSDCAVATGDENSSRAGFHGSLDFSAELRRVDLVNVEEARVA